ncbi:MAG: L,D-transpeptidase [Phascolarctobacterium sp.]|nr:L,D-transpeptidase [Phascolarctobacterium sp.]
MIEKGRSNNKSLYALLTAVFLILAGTAFGIYTLLFNTDKQQIAETPVPTKVEQKITPNQPTTSKPVIAKAEAAEQHNYSILIKKSEFKLKVLDNGNVIETFGCALGKNTGDKEKSGDMKTPNGTFKVIEVCDASWWTHDFKDGKGEIKGAYGPWFFYLDTNEKSKGQWDGIGIHGTHDPSSIGTLASEGCIRLLNENVQLLKNKYITVGTMVTIEE